VLLQETPLQVKQSGAERGSVRDLPSYDILFTQPLSRLATWQRTQVLPTSLHFSSLQTMGRGGSRPMMAVAISRTSSLVSSTTSKGLSASQ